MMRIITLPKNEKYYKYQKDKLKENIGTFKWIIITKYGNIISEKNIHLKKIY